MEKLPLLPLSECVHRGVYRLNSRNLTYGAYNESRKEFVGIRCKFGSRFLDAELHYDADSYHGTVKGMQLVGMLPDELKPTVESPTPGSDPHLFYSNRPLFEYLDKLEQGAINASLP